MNLKSRFVVPIRSRYAFATDHFNLVEIVSGNEARKLFCKSLPRPRYSEEKRIFFPS